LSKFAELALCICAIATGECITLDASVCPGGITDLSGTCRSAECRAVVWAIRTIPKIGGITLIVVGSTTTFVWCESLWTRARSRYQCTIRRILAGIVTGNNSFSIGTGQWCTIVVDLWASDTESNGCKSRKNDGSSEQHWRSTRCG